MDENSMSGQTATSEQTFNPSNRIKGGLLDATRARELKHRLTIYSALVRHGVTIWLVCSLTVVSPLGLGIAIHIAGPENVDKIIEFHRSWFSAVAGLTGTAVGAYFVGMKRRGHG